MKHWMACSCLLLFSGLLGCSKPDYNPELPLSTELGNPRGYRVVRTLIHMHSPYSYDACDKNGLINGIPDPECLSHLRTAFCRNHIDVAFLTDHPDNQAQYEMQNLLLWQAGDSLLTQATLTVANQMGGCPDGFSPLLTMGFESKLMALGMTKHLEPVIANRLTAYALNDVTLTNRLKTEADAVVAIPHTENRTVSDLIALSPDAIEIFNIHAILDPKIRKTDLNLPPFEQVGNIIGYLIDPYGETNPDFSFLHFLKLHSKYFEKWHAMINGGSKVAGIGGSDSHENIFKQKGSDGERLDAHRRLTRMMSNHFLVSTLDYSSIKSAIRAARGWMVFEGLGSPVGFDFYAVSGSSTIGVGETGTLSGGSATITVKKPTLHASSPGAQEVTPRIRLVLYKILPNNESEVLGTSVNADLTVQVAQTGAYRAQLYITPLQLKDFLGPFEDDARTEYPWIVTNPLYLQ